LLRKEFFQVLGQLMSRCAGAGREHSQAAGPRWPVEIFHTIGVMLNLGMGLAGGQEAFSLSVQILS